MKNRKGKWTDEENHMLTKIVQEYTERGETKTAAFKKAANLLGRTAAACSHRWNAVLSKVESTPTQTVTQPLQLPPPASSLTSELDLAQVIDYLRQFQIETAEEDLLQENRQLQEEQEVLKEEFTRLTKSLDNKKEEYQNLLQQYEEFTKILNETETLISGHSVH